MACTLHMEAPLLFGCTHGQKLYQIPQNGMLLLITILTTLHVYFYVLVCILTDNLETCNIKLVWYDYYTSYPSYTSWINFTCIFFLYPTTLLISSRHQYMAMQ